MAPWGDAKLFFCILFITCCCTVTLAQIPLDCCLSVKNKKVDKQIIVDYRQQLRGMGCSIDATVMTTRRGKKLCVFPNAPWVPEVLKHVDHLKKICKENNKTIIHGL
uniref:C-C motif chemokine 19-like n=1 Tax=Seriola dumerili TaxID=41447 RepID=A0A3B4V7L4_SERDU